MECLEDRIRPNLNGVESEEIDDDKKEKAKLHNYKLLVDPFIKGNGAKKIYRFDGFIPEDPTAPIVVAKDPRRQSSHLWTFKKLSDLPLPRFKIDHNYSGNPPPIEITITNINDNIREKFLEDMCIKYGSIEELKIFYHPTSKKHLTIGRVVYMQPKYAKLCIEKLNKTSVMGKALNVFLDPRGTHCFKIVDCLINSNPAHPFDINQYVLKNIDSHNENQNSYSLGPITNFIDIHKSDLKNNSLLKIDPRLTRKELSKDYEPQSSHTILNNTKQASLDSEINKQTTTKIDSHLKYEDFDNIFGNTPSEMVDNSFESVDNVAFNNATLSNHTDSPKSNASDQILSTQYTLQLLTNNTSKLDANLMTDNGPSVIVTENSVNNNVIQPNKTRSDLPTKKQFLFRSKYNSIKNIDHKPETRDKFHKDKIYSSAHYVSSKYDKYRHSFHKNKNGDGHFREKDYKRHENSKHDHKVFGKGKDGRGYHHKHNRERSSHGNNARHHSYKSSTHNYSDRKSTTHKTKESKVFFHSKKLEDFGHPPAPATKTEDMLPAPVPPTSKEAFESPILGEENDIDKMSLSPLSSYEEDEEVTQKLGRCKSKIVTPAKTQDQTSFNALQSRFGVNVVWPNQAPNTMFPPPPPNIFPANLPPPAPYNLGPPPPFMPAMLGPPPPIIQPTLTSPLKNMVNNLAPHPFNAAPNFAQDFLIPAPPSHHYYTFNAIFQKISPNYQEIIKKVISKLFEDLSLIINKDLQKNLVQRTAFTFYDKWWQENEEKHREIKFPESAMKMGAHPLELLSQPNHDTPTTEPKPGNQGQISLLPTKDDATAALPVDVSLGISNPPAASLLSTGVGEGTKSKRWVPPSRRDATELLNSLFETAKDPWRSYTLDNSLSLGIRASMPKMPSFRKIRKVTPQPSTPLKDNQNVLNQTQEEHKVPGKSLADHKNADTSVKKAKSRENVQLDTYKPSSPLPQPKITDEDSMSGILSESELSAEEEERNNETEIPSSSVDDYLSDHRTTSPPPKSSRKASAASKAVRVDEELPETATYQDLDESDSSSLFERPTTTRPSAPSPISSPADRAKSPRPAGIQTAPQPSELPVKFLSEHCYSLPPSAPAGKKTSLSGLATYMASDKAKTLKNNANATGATHVATKPSHESTAAPAGPRKYERKQLPAAVSKKRYAARDGIEEMRILYNIWNPGIDAEDIRYIKRSYDRLLLSDNPGSTQQNATVTAMLLGQHKGSDSENRYLWLNYTHWVPHMATFEEPPSKRLKSLTYANKSGSARTEGYYKISPEEKATYLTYQTNERKEPNKKFLNQVTTSRQVRSDFRRQLWSKSLEMGDLIKFNQLKARKKQIAFKKSYIHDWGLYANEPMGADEMVIEYVGEIVRQVVADKREKIYTEKGIGSSYLFRIDADTIIDATKCGNLARFINHSCNPNCYAKIISVDQIKKIVIYSKQPINVGEEITYDYKFPIEEDKIPCLCGASNCRGTLN